MEALSKKPPALVADMFQRLRHNETFGTGAVEEMTSAGSLVETLSTRRGALLHAEAAKAIANQRWREGAIYAETPTYRIQTSSHRPHLRGFVSFRFSRYKCEVPGDGCPCASATDHLGSLHGQHSADHRDARPEHSPARVALEQADEPASPKRFPDWRDGVQLLGAPIPSTRSDRDYFLSIAFDRGRARRADA